MLSPRGAWPKLAGSADLTGYEVRGASFATTRPSFVPQLAVALTSGLASSCRGIPARSPDLSPVEQFWSWLRRRLRAMDLADLIAQRQPVQKRALRARVRRLVLSLAAKDVAKHIFSRFRKTCLEVQRKRGAAARG